MKKLILTMLAILAVLALAAGCSKHEAEAPLAASTPEATVTSTPTATITTTPTPSQPAPVNTTTTVSPSSFKVSGTNHQTSNIKNSEKTENGQYSEQGSVHLVWQGDLEGDSDESYDLEIGVADGKIAGSGEGTFEGTVKGKNGTFTYNSSTSGQMFSADTGAMTHTCTIVSGTGELSDLKGTFTASELFGPDATDSSYTGTLSFGVVPVSTPSIPATPGVYTWEEAGNHIGETATVTGPIIDSMDMKTINVADYIVLGMGQKWMAPGYFAIGLKVDRATLPADLYVGKTISVTGDIMQVPTGAPGIYITDLSQIQVVDEGTEVTPSTTPGVYTWEEAVNHIGETATVTGPIVDSFDLRTIGTGDNIVLGMGLTATSRWATGIELGVDRAELPADLYIGKTISVTGKIYKNMIGGAAILVTDLAQIEVQ
jgi:hypothetical protein